jgi:hypothetical protein
MASEVKARTVSVEDSSLLFFPLPIEPLTIAFRLRRALSLHGCSSSGAKDSAKAAPNS